MNDPMDTDKDIREPVEKLPEQDEDTLRRVRSNYRQLLAESESTREAVMAAGSNDILLDQLTRANSLYEHVTTTHDATLDSQILKTAADLGARKAALDSARLKLFDVDSFLLNIRNVLLDGNGGGGRNAIGTQGELMSWDRIGAMVQKRCLTVPTMSFMLGPMAVEHVVKKKEKKAASAGLQKDIRDLRRPTEVRAEDLALKENETNRNMRVAHEVLRKNENIPYWKFVINPKSFSQTVENIFYCAHLVREGKIGIDAQDEHIGLLYALEGDEVAEPDTERLQYMACFDMKTWETMIDKFKIKESVIPHRAPSDTLPKK